MNECQYTPVQLWIGGKWTESDKIGESINPSSGAVVGSFYDGGEAEAHAAVEAASEAFATTSWSGSGQVRATAIERLADAIESRVPAIAAMLSSCNCA
jgi:betaine-aldehyde dehydrogenase